MRNLVWLWVSALVVLLDQASKTFAQHLLSYEHPVKLTSFFNLTLNYNFGAAFSFLGNAGGWQVYFLSSVAVIVSVILFVWLLRLTRRESLKALGLSLVIGGAIGNMIDRFRFGYVVDFFDFHIKGWHYATFNVADSAVCLGAFFLILGLIWKRT